MKFSLKDMVKILWCILSS